MRKTLLMFGLVLIICFTSLSAVWAEEQITLRVSWWGSQDRHNRTLAAIELFEERYPHVTVEAEFVGWNDYWERIATQAAGRNLPDVFQQDMQYIDLYSSRGMLLDLNPYVENGLLDTTFIADTELAGGKIDGKLYGINLGSNALVGIIDPEMFAQAGVEPPGPEWTWDDYVQIAQAITGKLGVPFAPVLPGQIFHAFQHVLRQRGLSLYATAGSGLGYDDDQILADLLQLDLDLTNQGVLASPAVRDEIGSLEEEPMITKEAASVWHWSNAIVALTVAADRPLALITLPKAKDQVKEGLYVKPSMFFSVAETSPHKELAVEFIDFFINDVEANKILFAERGVPISAKVREGLEPLLTDVQVQMFNYLNLITQHSSAIDPPEPPGHPEVLRLLQDIESMVLHGAETPLDAAKMFRQEATRILKNQ